MTRHFSRVVLWVLTIVALNACAMGGGAIKVSGYIGRGFPASSVSEKAIDVGNQSPTVFNPSGGNYQSAQRVMQLDIKAEAIRVK